MTSRRAAAGLLLIGLLLTACSGAPPAPVSERSRHDQGRVPARHEVRKGETLYSIAWSYGLDYRQVARWNGIGAPYRIFPGQTLRLRPSTVRSAAAPAPRPAPPKAANPAPTKPRPQPSNRTVSWAWPTEGRLLRTFSASQGKKGIDIAGRPGQPIRAAADGEVVYSGDGLLRYGKLIIIKHDAVYFSAYAHNRTLLVREGERVRKGQRIAEMGSTGTTRTMLHFEVRRNGESVDPLKYLPRQRL